MTLTTNIHFRRIALPRTYNRALQWQRALLGAMYRTRSNERITMSEKTIALALLDISMRKSISTIDDLTPRRGYYEL